MEHYVISYDIRNDKRRTKVFKILKEYAARVQYSIFEANISKEDIIILKYRLRRVMNSKEDSIFFYRQCRTCHSEIERLGLPVVVYGETDIIV